jgi:hypothetical protein
VPGTSAGGTIQKKAVKVLAPKAAERAKKRRFYK